MILPSPLILTSATSAEIMSLPRLTATFDDQSRLTKLEAPLTPPPAAPSESWDEFQLRQMLGG